MAFVLLLIMPPINGTHCQTFFELPILMILKMYQLALILCIIDNFHFSVLKFQYIFLFHLRITCKYCTESYLISCCIFCYCFVGKEGFFLCLLLNSRKNKVYVCMYVFHVNESTPSDVKKIQFYSAFLACFFIFHWDSYLPVQLIH